MLPLGTAEDNGKRAEYNLIGGCIVLQNGHQSEGVIPKGGSMNLLSKFHNESSYQEAFWPEDGAGEGNMEGVQSLSNMNLHGQFYGNVQILSFYFFIQVETVLLLIRKQRNHSCACIDRLIVTDSRSRYLS